MQQGEGQQPAGATKAGAHDGYVGTLDSAVLHNVNQFHKWHAELEAACALETEEKYKRYADLLSSHLTTCEGILKQARFASHAVQLIGMSGKQLFFTSGCLLLALYWDKWH